VVVRYEKKTDKRRIIRGWMEGNLPALSHSAFFGHSGV
jgi:hypothetical protein